MKLTYMEHKAFMRLIVLFLGFSYVLISCVALPTARTLKSNKENPSSVQDLLAQDALETLLKEREREGYTEGRMDMENTVDYPGTGANTHHDPKTPGKP